MVGKGLKSPEETEEEKSRDKMKISTTARLKFKTGNENQLKSYSLWFHKYAGSRRDWWIIN
jgi:hypothetical protein